MTSLRIVTFLALTLAFGFTSRAQNVGQSPTARTTNSGALRVLFIGNSYTYFNNLPQMLVELARAARESNALEVEMVAVGGATLKSLWERGAARNALQRSRWDYVVLQEQSTLGPAPLVNGRAQISNPKTFHEYARLFDTEIKKTGAQTIFYLTWARQNQAETQAALSDAYLRIAQELNAIVAPVGLAWESALKQDSQLALHQDDKSHPTPRGSYLAACVFYATIFGKTPAGLPARVIGNKVDTAGRVEKDHGAQEIKVELVNLAPAEAALLQRIAWQTIKQQRP